MIEFQELLKWEEYKLLEYYRNSPSDYDWMGKTANNDTIVIIRHEGFSFNYNGSLIGRRSIDRSPIIERRTIKKGGKINLGRAENVVAWDKKDFLNV